MFQQLCALIGQPELSSDARFSSTAARHENRDELAVILQKEFLKKTAKEWVGLLEENGVPVSLIQNLEEVCQDPQVTARHMMISSEDPELAAIQLMATPIKMTALPDQLSRPAAPALGQDTIGILHDLGMNDSEIEELKKEGVI